MSCKRPSTTLITPPPPPPPSNNLPGPFSTSLLRKRRPCGAGVSTPVWCGAWFGPNPTSGSVLPVGRYKTKDVAGDRHPADGRERQVSGHQRLAGRCQLLQETDPDADRLLGVVVEGVVPVGVVEMVREHGIAEERQPVAAGRQADHAVPGGVAAGATDDHPRRHLVLLLERPQLAAVHVDEPLFARPKHVRKPAKSVPGETGH